jgi:hypothetical protein
VSDISIALIVVVLVVVVVVQRAHHAQVQIWRNWYLTASAPDLTTLHERERSGHAISSAAPSDTGLAVETAVATAKFEAFPILTSTADADASAPTKRQAGISLAADRVGSPPSADPVVDGKVVRA